METGLMGQQDGISYFGAFPSVNVQVKEEKDAIPQDKKGESELCIACSQGNINTVKHLIENGTDVNEKDNAKLTPISRAAINGHIYVVDFLIRKGAKITYKLLCMIKAKIDILEENAKQGKTDPYEVANWKSFLEHLIEEGKKQ